MFFSGVVILTLSNVIVKAIGLFFKIPMSHYLGELGMGYFNAAYNIYTWFFMISTAGLPVAISILVSEAIAKGNYKQVKRIYRMSVLIFFVIGLLGMTLMAAGSGFFSGFMKNEDSIWCILAIAPTLFFICISSAIRGYFQGFQNMIPTAISQVIEAACKLLIGLLLAVWAIDKGYELHFVAAFAISGLTIGVALSMLFLVISKMLFNETRYGLDPSASLMADEKKKVFSNLAKIALPITVSSSVMSLTNIIDLMIVSRRLQDIGIEQNVAVSMYGNYTTCAVPLYNLPPVLIYPIAYSIVPLITTLRENGEKKKIKGLVDSTLRVTAIIAQPCALGLAVMSRPILELLFSEKDVSMNLAAPLLSLLAPSTLLVCILAVSNSFLQANGHENKPIISMLVGSAVKLVSSYVLVGIPGVEIYGTPISTFLCYTVVCTMNFYFIIVHVCKLPGILRVFAKPFVASLFCVLCALVFDSFAPSLIGSEGISTILAILLAAVVYAIMIFVLRAITEDDIKVLPKGDKIYRVLTKIKLMK